MLISMDSITLINKLAKKITGQDISLPENLKNAIKDFLAEDSDVIPRKITKTRKKKRKYKNRTRKIKYSRNL
jgi:hypothetical protein